MPHLLSGAAKGAAHLIPDGKTQFLALQYTARRDTVIRSAKIRTFFLSTTISTKKYGKSCELLKKLVRY